MYTLTVKSHFDAAHYIKDYKGKCSRLHGHRWDVEVVYGGSKLDTRNILVDFKTVKDFLEDTLEHFLDHYFLNEVLDEPNVTAEYLAKWLYDKLSTVEILGGSLISLTIWESPDCSVTYTKEEVI